MLGGGAELSYIWDVMGVDCISLPFRDAEWPSRVGPTSSPQALPNLRALILLLIYPPSFSFESSIPCTIYPALQPLTALFTLPSLYLVLLLRDLPIYILNLCLPFLCLFNPHINLVYGLHHALPEI